ncbi:DNA oxidative demethylase AlkB [Chitiniphilus purpureus]|uniref:DNA oxidative demethylase AlkB n=1 Tax=Chitiniphilus purpureus TaxID=2981137 RepID=A0ABY6DLQ4_9NEIS|nr:DNA oxidative demethylase AlkB [Chitiniphilus sp. CD1]UXY15309.1 DNA oxidative demethylase AlkB [Chitiniphilus sp. CD1]
MSYDLFQDLPGPAGTEPLGEGASLLHGFARDAAPALLAAMHGVLDQAPLRHWQTSGGYTLGVAMSNCGPVGWVSDARGYRYQPIDPLGNAPWPALPPCFAELARAAAAAAGYPGFEPDACLINRYERGTRLSLHQDRNERDFAHPIVSISLGLPAVFLFGGAARSDKPRRFRLEHGDVAVWGGATRLAYHGIAPLAAGTHPLTGPYRYNLTLRRAR